MVKKCGFIWRSPRSAAFIMDMIDRDRYQVIPVGITRQGQ